MQLRTRACILVVALAGGLASTTAVADDLFLKFGGDILGDSTDAQHPDEIVLLSYAFGVDADTSWTRGGGASVGKPNPGDLRFTAVMNRSVAAIVKHITRGNSAPTATLTVRSTAPGSRAGFEYVKYTFTGLFFTSVDQGLTGTGRAVNSVSAVYKTVQIEQFAPGDPRAVSCVKWDVPAGTVEDC